MIGREIATILWIEFYCMVDLIFDKANDLFNQLKVHQVELSSAHEIELRLSSNLSISFSVFQMIFFQIGRPILTFERCIPEYR